MENQEIAFQIVHHSIVSEHELMVAGIVYREKKEMIKTSDDSDGVKTDLVHIRYIGDEDYLKVTQSLKNGKLEDEKIDSNLSDEDIENFKKQWENEWHPTLISNDQTQGSYSTGMVDKIKIFFGFN